MITHNDNLDHAPFIFGMSVPFVLSPIHFFAANRFELQLYWQSRGLLVSSVCQVVDRGSF